MQTFNTVITAFPYCSITEDFTLLTSTSERETLKGNDFVLLIPSIMSRRRQWHPTPVLLPGKFHGWRSLKGYSPWGREESDTTERLHFHFSLSCIGEGNGNPLQCSCLENPRDRGAWWASVYGVAQSWTRLTRLSSSSSSRANKFFINGGHQEVALVIFKGLDQGSHVDFSSIKSYLKKFY